MTQPYIIVFEVTAYPCMQPRPEHAPEGWLPREGYAIVSSSSIPFFDWVEKSQFEAIALPMGHDNDGSKITGVMVDDFIAKVESSQIGQKTTATMLTMANGFEVLESSSCVDPKNFSMEMGERICVDRIKNKIWNLLGFLLQCATHGLNYEKRAGAPFPFARKGEELQAK